MHGQKHADMAQTEYGAAQALQHSGMSLYASVLACLCVTMCKKRSTECVVAPLQSNYFRGDANTAISESSAAFQQRVNNAPTPSSS